MSQPIWSSLDPLTITGTTLDLGHGNWEQNDLTPLVGLDGKQPSLKTYYECPAAPEWLPLIQIDGKVVYGQAPGLPSVPAATIYPGQLAWGSRLPFDLSRYVDGTTHVLSVDIWAAQYFTGWGDHPADAWEWGYYNAKGEPAHLTRSFTLAVSPPPPSGPTPADIVAAETWLGEAVNSLKQSYAWTHTTAASYAQVHASADSIGKAVAFLEGTA